MTKKEELLLPWECTFGRKSHINLLGKIIFSPLILIMCSTYCVMVLFFEKSDAN